MRRTLLAWAAVVAVGVVSGCGSPTATTASGTGASTPPTQPPPPKGTMPRMD